METTLSSDSKLPQQLSTIELKTDKTTRYKLMHNLLLCFSFFLRDSWRVLLLSQIHHITANSSSIERFLQVHVLQIPGYWIISKSLEVNEKTKDYTEMPKWDSQTTYIMWHHLLFFFLFSWSFARATMASGQSRIARTMMESWGKKKISSFIIKYFYSEIIIYKFLV